MTDTPKTPPPASGAGGDTTDGVADEIATLATLISQARELVASGHTVDLAGLSDKVGAFCRDLAKNPPADVDSVTRMIEALVGDLNALAQEITEQHEKAIAGGGHKGNGS